MPNPNNRDTQGRFMRLFPSPDGQDISLVEARERKPTVIQLVLEHLQEKARSNPLEQDPRLVKELGPRRRKRKVKND